MLHNLYYKGYSQLVEVTNLIIFDILANTSALSSNFLEDTKLVGVFGLNYPELSDEMTSVGTAILGDLAFGNSSSVTNCNILPALNSNAKSEIPESTKPSVIIITLQRIMPSQWQSS